MSWVLRAPVHREPRVLDRRAHRRLAGVLHVRSAVPVWLALLLAASTPSALASSPAHGPASSVACLAARAAVHDVPASRGDVRGQARRAVGIAAEQQRVRGRRAQLDGEHVRAGHRPSGLPGEVRARAFASSASVAAAADPASSLSSRSRSAPAAEHPDAVAASSDPASALPAAATPASAAAAGSSTSLSAPFPSFPSSPRRPPARRPSVTRELKM